MTASGGDPLLMTPRFSWCRPATVSTETRRERRAPGAEHQASPPRAITATVVLLGLAGAAEASDAFREQAVAFERMCRMREAIRLHERAARGGDARSAGRLSELYDQGANGVPRDYAESLKWADVARRLGEVVPTPNPSVARPQSACKPQPYPGPGPGAFYLSFSAMPRGDTRAVVRHPTGLLFASSRAGVLVESVKVELSVPQWRAFRESLDRLNIWQWRPEYSKPVTDGRSWSLNIEYVDRRLAAEGHNDDPDDFDAFLEVVDRLLGSRKLR